MRYERKYRVEGLSVAEIRAVIASHPLAFHTDFPDRRVNNLYFDTPDLDCFQDNLRGVSQRVKYRLRWYGPEQSESPTLEIKRKDGALGDKLSYPQTSFSSTSFQTDLDLPPLQATLFNHYQRSYFRSFDGRFRLTVDWDMGFQEAIGGRAVGPVQVDPAVIIEVKYAAELDGQYDEVGQYLPYRWGKNSKYVTGMLLVG